MVVSVDFKQSQEKEHLRIKIWNCLKEKGLSKRPEGDKGKIPDFKGSKAAARRLSRTIEWSKADLIFCSPDSTQQPVREIALEHGKDLIMATPKIDSGYLLLKGKNLKDKSKIASTIKGAFKYGKRIDKLPPVDLVVEGSVAVDENGNRLGKGGGYADIEISELFKQKSIKISTPIITTIHPLQIVAKIPVELHDQKINMIVTPHEVIRLSQDPELAIVY